MRMEKCAYQDQGIECGQDNSCDGYKPHCSMYTTHGHLEGFCEMFHLVELQEVNTGTCICGLEKKFEESLNQGNHD